MAPLLQEDAFKRMKDLYGVDDHEATEILQVTLAQAIGVFQELDWTTKEFARNEDGQWIHDPLTCEEEQLESICAVCIYGAVSYGIRMRQDEFVHPEDQTKAINISTSYIFNLVQDEPEAQGRRLAPPNWNDNLPKDEGKNRVIALLQRGLDQLQ